MGLGNNVNALNDARSAVNMEPDNMQYRMLLQRLEGGGTWYQEQQNPFGGMPSDGSDYCMKLCLANWHVIFAARVVECSAAEKNRQ